MKVSAEFVDGVCVLNLTPSDEWEQKLLGAVAKGENKLQATVTYHSEGHYSYEKCESVRVVLQSHEEQT